MKVINIILASIIIYLGVGSTCFAQENDKALLERVDKVYRLIPIDLNTDELLQKINEVEKYVGLVIDSIESKEAKEKARLIQAKGLLWSLGSYVFETGDKGLKDEEAHGKASWRRATLCDSACCGTRSRPFA